MIGSITADAGFEFQRTNNTIMNILLLHMINVVGYDNNDMFIVVVGNNTSLRRRRRRCCG